MWSRIRLPSIYVYAPLDQSAAYILGLIQKKNSIFGPLGGNKEDLRGPKSKKCTNLVHFLGAIFTIELG